MSKLKVGDVVQILDDHDGLCAFDLYEIGLVMYIASDIKLPYPITILQGGTCNKLTQECSFKPEHLQKIGTLD